MSELRLCSDSTNIVISVIWEGFPLGVLESRDGETSSDGPSWKYGYRL